jgi:riboflavin kinase/FMN adenylyltransferase
VRVWQRVGDVPPSWGPCVVAIGVFDGVHRGHVAMLARALDHARRDGRPLVVLTFDPHPAGVVRPGAAPELLGTVADRAALLRAAGADAVLVLDFTPELAAVPAAEFVRTVLVDELRVTVVVVGEGFRFGHRAAGDVATLRELGERYGFVVDAVPLAADETDRYSSTRIRALLAAGDVAEAAELLGRPYGITGVVVEGDKRGRELGFPTANLACPPGIVVPPDGVYAGRLSDGPDRWPAAISVGSNPTFEGASRRVEAYALDRDDLELYGHEVTVSFVERLREMVAFTSIDELIVQVAADVDRSRSVLAAQAERQFGA